MFFPADIRVCETQLINRQIGIAILDDANLFLFYFDNASIGTLLSCAACRFSCTARPAITFITSGAAIPAIASHFRLFYPICSDDCSGSALPGLGGRVAAFAARASIAFIDPAGATIPASSRNCFRIAAIAANRGLPCGATISPLAGFRIGFAACTACAVTGIPRTARSSFGISLASRSSLCFVDDDIAKPLNSPLRAQTLGTVAPIAASCKSVATLFPWASRGSRSSRGCG
jgi:hypothetical protein